VLAAALENKFAKDREYSGHKRQNKAVGPK
jgi:hypothetical protein